MLHHLPAASKTAAKGDVIQGPWGRVEDVTQQDETPRPSADDRIDAARAAAQEWSQMAAGASPYDRDRIVDALVEIQSSIMDLVEGHDQRAIELWDWIDGAIVDIED